MGGQGTQHACTNLEPLALAEIGLAGCRVGTFYLLLSLRKLPHIQSTSGVLPGTCASALPCLKGGRGTQHKDTSVEAPGSCDHHVAQIPDQEAARGLENK